MTILCLYGGWMSERATRRDFLLQIDLWREREKSQAMLDNMLPPHISSKLGEARDEGRTGALIASLEPQVTVLFCEILDFHRIVSKLQPTELVTLLDRVWSRFDELSERHCVQKMETVGVSKE